MYEKSHECINNSAFKENMSDTKIMFFLYILSYLLDDYRQNSNQKNFKIDK